MDEQKIIINDQVLIQKIEATYRSDSNQQIQQAEQYLKQVARHPQYISKLFGYISPSATFDNLFKHSASIQLKKRIYDVAEEDCDKSGYIMEIYGLLKSEGAPRKVKQELAVAVEYILNKDAQNIYRPDFFNRIHSDQQQEQNFDAIHGLMYMNIASLNSLVEVEQISLFFIKMLPVVSRIAIYLLEQLGKIQNQIPQNQIPQKLFNPIKVLFEYLQIALARIFDEKDLIQEQIKYILGDITLIAIFQAYLYYGKKSNSIVTADEQTNSIKALITEAMFHMYVPHKIPQPLFTLLFSTVISESMRYNERRQEQQQKILCRCIEIVEQQLVQKNYDALFNLHKTTFLFSLLLYCVTTQEEQEEMQSDPDKFSYVSEQFSEAFSSAGIIRVRAACFLKNLLSYIDAAPRNLIEICTVVIATIMPSRIPGQSMADIKEVFNKFAFCSLSPKSQLETVFNVLTIASTTVSKREDLNEIVYSLISTNYENLLQLTEPLVIVRVVRLLGYFPAPAYYPFIQSKMGTNKACLIEGLKSFQRILRHRQYPQIYQMLAEIFYQLLDHIKITDPIAQTLLLNNYDTIISKSQKLFTKAIQTLIKSFYQNAQKQQQQATQSLNFICSILAKEKSKQKRDIIQRQVGSILQVCESSLKYEEKAVQIYTTLLSGQPEIDQKVYAFGESKICKLQHFGNNSVIYEFYNKFFLKMSSSDSRIEYFYLSIFSKLVQLCSKPVTGGSIIPHLSFLLCQIIHYYRGLAIKEDSLLLLFGLAQNHATEARTSILCTILTFIYVQPRNVRAMLIKQGTYQQGLKMLLNQRYQGKFPRKIFVLGMTSLLEVEEKYFKDILLACVAQLKLQQNAYRIKSRQKRNIQAKTRRPIQARFDDQQEFIEASNPEHNQNDYWNNFFSKLKHPTDNYSEFQQFKVRAWQNSNVIDQLSQQTKNDLRQLMETDWWHNKVRRVVKVVRNKQDKLGGQQFSSQPFKF